MFRTPTAAITIWLAVFPAHAAPTVQPISGEVPMFCRDTSGMFQPFARTNYARLQESFARQFGWQATLVGTSASLGTLTFAQNDIRSSERIVYDVGVYNGGIALLHMHVRLKGITRDLSGTEMCGQTFAIVNER